MKYNFNEDDKRQLAHFIAQRFVSAMTSGGETNKAFDYYIEQFNEVMDKTEMYNKSV